MPWKECQPMDERLRFIARLLEGEKMAPLCREFGISRVGIDKLTCRRGLALQDRGLNAQYVDASAHCGRIFKSKHV